MGNNLDSAVCIAWRHLRTCFVACLVALMLAFLVFPSIAWADDDATGDVDDPTTRSSAAASISQQATASESASSSEAAHGTGAGGASSSAAASTGTTAENAAGSAGDSAGSLEVSSDNTAARSTAVSFALSEFSRAQVGSNRAIADAYRGYAYYAGSHAPSMVLIATPDYAVVYVSPEAAAREGLTLSAEADRAALRSMVGALDAANANGGAVLGSSARWYFTSDETFEVDGAVFHFNQDFGDGRIYECITDTAGGDITDSERDLPDGAVPIKLTHACFAELVAFDDADIAPAPTWIESLGGFLSSIDYSPLWVTLKTTGCAIVFIFVLGLAAAYFCLGLSARWRDVFDAIFTIPMVLPPTVCGFILLLALGNNTGVGRWFISVGFPLIFSWPATVIAAVVVAFPLMYRSARGAFESLDPVMLDAARTLGWSNARIFFKLMLPLSWSSIAAGTVLAFARALGEFGATLFLAGNYLGVTRTIPIAIYFEWMNGNTDTAIFWTVVIMAFSFLVIVFINLWGRRTVRYRKGATR